jgi:nucleoside-triphosphatase
LTGRPGSGKSTLVRAVVEALRQGRIAAVGGFYTLEVRQAGIRTGFSIQTIDGQTGRLAEVGLPSRYRLGRYGIDMGQFKSVALTALEAAVRDRQLVVIDEIGSMELQANDFKTLVQEALDGVSPVLATIMRKPLPFADEVKRRPDVELIEVRPDNRDVLVATLSNSLRWLLLNRQSSQSQSTASRLR